jgi:hypothetical protein
MGLGNRSEKSDALYEFEFYGASAWLTFGVLCVSWYELCIDLLVENTIRHSFRASIRESFSHDHISFSTSVIFVAQRLLCLTCLH